MTARVLKIGSAVIAETKPSGKPLDLPTLRLREIERLIRSRHGEILPEADDADHYLRAVALSCPRQDLGAWCRRWAPWAVDWPELLAAIVSEGAGRRRMLKADPCAEMLAVTFAERQRLGLRTIGATDLPAAERKRLVAERKREREKLRQRAKRAGATPRALFEASSLSAQAPWQALGISQRTWYRRRGGKGPLPIESHRKGNAPLPTPIIEEPTLSVKRDPFPTKGASSRTMVPGSGGHPGAGGQGRASAPARSERKGAKHG